MKNKQAGTWIVLSDIHVPFHNVVLIDKILNLIKEIKPRGIIIAGDFLDMFSISKYAENSLYALSGVTLGSEYAEGCKLLDKIDATFKGEKVFLFGNHEYRFYHWIQKGDNAKYGNAIKNPIEGLDLLNRGYKVISDYPDGVFKLGNHLEIIHGIYHNVHVAKKHLESLNTSVIFGHTHRFQSYYSNNSISYNIGWLGDINSIGFNYMNRAAKNLWCNGFAIVNIDDEGDFYVQAVQVHENKFSVLNKIY